MGLRFPTNFWKSRRFACTKRPLPKYTRRCDGPGSQSWGEAWRCFGGKLPFRVHETAASGKDLWIGWSAEWNGAGPQSELFGRVGAGVRYCCTKYRFSCDRSAKIVRPGGLRRGSTRGFISPGLADKSASSKLALSQRLVLLISFLVAAPASVHPFPAKSNKKVATKNLRRDERDEGGQATS